MVRKGQVALEFLTTYGWAFLIILIMIGTISYFGIMNPSKLLPSKCTVGSELSCRDYRIQSDGTIEVDLKQGIGKTVFLQEFKCSYEGDEDTDDFGGASPPWSPKDNQTMSCNLPAFIGLDGEKVKVYFEITYRRSLAGFDHLVSGELYTEVQ